MKAGRRPAPLVGVVGPCGAGKSTLIEGLEAAGYACRHIAQEHSYVKDMWKRITDPDLLIFLFCSFETATARRRLNWNRADYDEELRRLAHAREHADLLIETDRLAIEEVRARALQFLGSLGSA
jgi:RNase adaptor protein for sRNA GlmZ degradation